MSVNERYAFGGFQLDVADRALRRNGQTISLTPKAHDMLVTLIQNRHRVVSKEELLDAVWPGTFVEDGIVTVNVSTLRKTLGEAPDGRPFIETVPRRGYRFAGFVERLDEPAPLPRTVGKYWLLVPVALFFAGLAVLWPRSEAPLTPRIIPLTTYPGRERNPTFSPDGNQVAFSWNGPNRDNFDIYVKVIASDAPPLRLTRDPGADVAPAWSPDGRHIAFSNGGAIYLISPLGGAIRKLAEACAGCGRIGDKTDRFLAWSPDSRTLAAAEGHTGIVLLSIDTGKVERVTTTWDSAFGDLTMSFSPDGGRLVFTRWPHSSSADLFLLNLSNRSLRRLTNVGIGVFGVGWMPNGEVIFSSGPCGNNHNNSIKLLSVSGASANSEPVPIPFLPAGASYPVIGRRGDSQTTMLAYDMPVFDTNIWRMEIGGAPAAAPVITSSRDDNSPSFSPDGKHIAFGSNRSGQYEVWVARGDGKEERQVTSMRADYLNTMRWSPDGQQLLFAALFSGNRDIYVVPVGGGVAQRLTSEASNEGRPSWSGDGRWIYFYSDRGGTQQVWKMPVAGGTAVQVTRTGGEEAVESRDGKWLYIESHSPHRTGLWRISLANAEKEEPLIDRNVNGGWALTSRGLMYVDHASGAGPSHVKLLDPETKKTVVIAKIDNRVAAGAPAFSVSPDSRHIAWVGIDYFESDLMLVENFESRRQRF